MYKVGDYTKFKGNVKSVTLLNLKDITVIITPAVEEEMYNYLYNKRRKMNSISDVVNRMNKFESEGREYYYTTVYTDRYPCRSIDEYGDPNDDVLITSYRYKDQYLEVRTDTEINSVRLKRYLLANINQQFLSDNLDEDESDTAGKIMKMIDLYCRSTKSNAKVAVEVDVIPNDQPPPEEDPNPDPYYMF